MGPFRAKRGNLRARRHVRLHLEALEDRWLPSQIFTVNSAADDPLGEPAGSSVATLRDAINALNLDTSTTFSNPDVISFAIASGTQTINLAADRVIIILSIMRQSYANTESLLSCLTRKTQ